MAVNQECRRGSFEALAAEHLNPLHWWHPNMIGFRFDQPIRFPELIPCRGRLGFFELPEEVESHVEEMLR